jgi:CDP-diacylglycerol--glycerol-3-phosphate 3-phosphatidyltransferase
MPSSEPQPAVLSPPGVVNIANALTVLRFGLVPVFVAALVAGGPGWRTVAFAVFVAASFTDLLDGKIARQRGLITDFGKIADPIADKALTGAALVTLSVQGTLAWWVTAVILFREVAVTGLRFWVIHRGVIAASRGGKLKTLLQVVAIALFVLPGPPALVRDLLMDAAVVVTLATGVDYAGRAIRLRRRPVAAVVQPLSDPAPQAPGIPAPQAPGIPAPQGPGIPAPQGPGTPAESAGEGR